ncbi:dTDP-4-dehydrorhamnose reductase [Pseudorhodobacter sp.]|uniref:dTDP-4-dehydrorhamnose reductase n=1 Tax=Pseudorhodobacter sp. TaxID=1934400 RepID=UPI002AFECBCF|nr:dTDP-4-dehydrorhamnose reductase [Pseudorhodobacter sp.]
MILVFGRTGQVATELQQQAHVTALGRDLADLTDPAACAAAIRAHAPGVVINAAAYTAVDRAESEEALATTINADAPGAMARACAVAGIPFVHLSTDYVFDGSGTRPWSATDPVAPQNAYGRSKLKGEEAIRAAGGTYAILRTSWVFSAHGNNFVKTMLRLGKTHATLSVVEDQIGGPTPAAAIAAACLTIAAQLRQDPSKSGTYHFSGAPDVSWKAFACETFALAGCGVTVKGISTAEYPTAASRPLNSRLECADLHRVFGISRPDWRAATADIVKALKGPSFNEKDLF